MSAILQMLSIPSFAASADGHNGNRRLGSYDRIAPASLAIRRASMCVEREGCVIRLIEP